MNTPVEDPEDKPNTEKSIAGDMTEEHLQYDITQDPDEDGVK